jgi:hypothetical protein
MGYDATGKLAYGPNNLLTYSAGTVAQLNTSSNVTDAGTSITGFPASIQFADNAASRWAYKTATMSAGTAYSISVYVQMDDAGVPVIGTSSTTGDFGLVVDNNLCATPETPVAVGGGIYRVSALVASAVGGVVRNNGVVKYSTQTARTFRVTGYQLEAVTYQTTPRTYYPTTTAAYYGPRFVYDPVTLAALGILVEEARTNICLWNRDLTNAAWVKVNTTAAKDQTGIDGVANSASLITATAPAATILQTIILASSTRQQSAWVKRITGTGVVNMTTNGVTWTAVTVTAGWTRVTIPAQATVVNPVLGFQIMTSGDAIAVDFVQNETGAGASSEIATTTAAVTRAQDAAAVTGLVLTQAFSIVSMAQKSNNVSATINVATCSDGTNNNRLVLYSSGTVTLRAFGALAGSGVVAESGALTPGSPFKQAVSFDGVTTFSTSGNGAAVATGTKAINTPVLTQLASGQAPTGGEVIHGTISRIRIYNRALPDAQLQSLTS